jgi:L-lactate dehydrogenase complex protein LldG
MAENANDARREVLGRVRSKLGVRGDEPGRRGRVQSRLRNPQPNVIPERAKKPKPELIKFFQIMLENAGAKTVRVRSLKALPDAIAAALRDANLPLRVRAGKDAIFESLRQEPALLELNEGPAEATDAIGLSHALAGAAETGTLFLASGPGNPSTLNFLPENHVVAILAADIAGSYEECWSKLRSAYGGGAMPRTVNLVSGPSRTADIEQTIVMGAHGPKRLVVLIIGS